jgi:hypothetical protein
MQLISEGLQFLLSTRESGGLRIVMDLNSFYDNSGTLLLSKFKRT